MVKYIVFIMKNLLMKEAIENLLKLDIKSQNDLMLAKRRISKIYNISILQNSDILKYYQILVKKKLIFPNPLILRILRKRSIRTMSGIAPVAVLTKPYPCPGKCAYCPTETDVPQSYLSNEPAVMRAIRCGYDPYIQAQDRLRALVNNGHEPTKIEIIVIGGTWSYLPKKYKYWYIASLFRAANNFEKRDPEKRIKKNLNIKELRATLENEQKINERAKYNIIGLTLETRPDYIDEDEIIEMRELGCTRVELGVQAIDDKVLQINKRGHGVKEVGLATRLLKDHGFKVTYHIMPGLPGSTPTKDIRMFEKLFTDERFQPDQIKFYPTVVTKGSLLYRWWKQGKYKPYTTKTLEKIIIKCKKIIPDYVRIIRLIRDIPGESIVAGNKVTNLRQVMFQKGVECRCIRCREARQAPMGDLQLSVEMYQASEGDEYFISYNSEDGKILYGFCRLRLSRPVREQMMSVLHDSAIIRELHVYGELVSIGDKKKVQHAGLGKKLLLEAEKIAKIQGFDRMAIISGVGVRGYYRKQGYKLKETYTTKKLK